MAAPAERVVPAGPAMAATAPRLTLPMPERFQRPAMDLTALRSLPWAEPAWAERVLPAAPEALASEALAARVAWAVRDSEALVARGALAAPAALAELAALAALAEQVGSELVALVVPVVLVVSAMAARVVLAVPAERAMVETRGRLTLPMREQYRRQVTDLTAFQLLP